MDALITLKIKIDNVTGQISDFCARKAVRRVLLTIKWLAILYILIDMFFYRLYTGNSTLFSVVFIAVLTSLLTRKRKPIDATLIDKTDVAIEN